MPFKFDSVFIWWSISVNPPKFYILYSNWLINDWTIIEVCIFHSPINFKVLLYSFIVRQKTHQLLWKEHAKFWAHILIINCIVIRSILNVCTYLIITILEHSFEFSACKSNHDNIDYHWHNSAPRGFDTLLSCKVQLDAMSKHIEVTQSLYHLNYYVLNI